MSPNRLALIMVVGHSEKPVFNLWSEHPAQTNENGNPAHESYHHGPPRDPTIVDTDDRNASNEQR
jgi:hypothetical protein